MIIPMSCKCGNSNQFFSTTWLVVVMKVNIKLKYISISWFCVFVLWPSLCALSAVEKY